MDTGERAKRARITYRTRTVLMVAVVVLAVLIGRGVLTAPSTEAFVHPSSYGHVPPPARWHVVPDSDSEADQLLKLAVRDRLLPVVERVLTDVEDGSTAIERLVSKEDVLRRLAKAELASRDASDVDVAIETERNGLGEPLALRVVLGSGGGSNWFCVLVPPLCFSDLEPVENIPAQSDESPDGEGVRIGWKWFDKWFGNSAVPIEGVRDVDQNDVHADLAHTIPRNGDVRLPAEEPEDSPTSVPGEK